MKKIIVALATLFVLAACKNVAEKKPTDEKATYASFGKKISADSAITANEMFEKYKSLKDGDTISVKFASKINEVCQKKGCWMNLELDKESKSFVRFKDYGFFMPLNASGSEAIVNGKAFVSVISVDELKHYAKDEGKSQAAIDSIKEPEVTYSFLADGVLIKK